MPKTKLNIIKPLLSLNELSDGDVLHRLHSVYDGMLNNLELGKGRDVEYAAAFALALSGDSSGSQTLAEDLAKRFPEDTPVQFEYLPTLRALFALCDKAPSDAIDRLQTTLSYDLAMPGTAFFASSASSIP